MTGKSSPSKFIGFTYIIIVRALLGQMCFLFLMKRNGEACLPETCHCRFAE